MTEKFDGKPPVKNTGSNNPNGEPPKQMPVPIISKATIAKVRGGSAHINTSK
jgi:hypothetical protein